jgi:hypothetical protein
MLEAHIDARNAMVREAVYLRAQARGFQPAHELEAWLVAEHQVDALLFAKIAPVCFVGWVLQYPCR